MVGSVERVSYEILLEKVWINYSRKRKRFSSMTISFLRNLQLAVFNDIILIQKKPPITSESLEENRLPEKRNFLRTGVVFPVLYASHQIISC